MNNKQILLLALTFLVTNHSHAYTNSNAIRHAKIAAKVILGGAFLCTAALSIPVMKETVRRDKNILQNFFTITLGISPAIAGSTLLKSAYDDYNIDKE